MAMALAVAFVACQAAAPAKPADPEPGPQGPPGESPGHGPTTIGEVSVAVSLAASGPMASMEIDLAEHFHDPDGAAGETLTYQHASDDAAVATSAVAGNTLTITAAAAGNATISVTAVDKDELKSPTKKFKVTVTPAVAPMVKAGGIGPQTLHLADGAMDIVLTTSEGSEEGYFTHSSDISYAVSAAPIGYVEVSEANGTLTLKPLLEGTTIVTIVATADSEKTDKVTFRVTVEPGTKPVPEAVAPTVTERLPDIKLGTDYMSVKFDLSEHFSHPNSEITYSAMSEDKSIATASLEGSMLTVALADTGTTRVVVTATADGESETDRFQVEVVDDPVRWPYAMGTIPDMTLTDGEDPADTGTRDVEDNFGDPDDQDLDYRASSDNEDVATAMVAAGSSVVTVTAVGEGSATITVYAVDEDRLRSGTREFMVTVRPAETEETEPEAPVADGMISAMTVEAEKVLDAIDVSMYFTPKTGLTYKAMSSDVDKATADIPTGSSMLTITGVAEGTATVTVTAKNDAGMITQTIAVKVTAAMAPYKPSNVPIPGAGKSSDISIDEDETLQPIDGTADIEVSPKAGFTTVWTITGVTKGKATVRILEANGGVERSIPVTIANTPPEVIPNHDTSRIPAGPVDGPTVYRLKDGKYTDTTIALTGAEPADSKERIFHQFVVDYAKYFKEADGWSDIDVAADTSYKAVSLDDTYARVVRVDKAVITPGTPTTVMVPVVVDIGKKVGATIPLEISVVDEDGGESGKTVVRLETQKPLPDKYAVAQTSRVFNVRVWNRQDVTHTLSFDPYKSGGADDGFGFVSDFIAGLALAAADNTALLGTTPVISKNAPDADWKANEVSGEGTTQIPVGTADYYHVVYSGDIKPATGDGITEGLSESGVVTNGEPMLSFTVEGTKRSSVRITYWARVVATDGGEVTIQSEEAVVWMNIIPSF